MGLIQIGASILAALLVAALPKRHRDDVTRGAWRTYLLLAFSVLAVFWFQPAVPLRSFDFWLPSLSLTFIILTWSISSQTGAWKSRHNLIGLCIIIGLVTLTDLSRYIFHDPFITATVPPQLIQYLVFALIGAVVILALTRLLLNNTWILSIAIILLLSILVVLKSPALSLQTSIFFRTLAHRPVDNASALDLRWLGFSYIAFRLIHVLRDRQLRRLPELMLPEFATYVVFFPSLSAGP